MGVSEDVTGALRAEEHGHQPSVVTYDARGNGDGKTVCTITGDHQNRVTDYTALAIPINTMVGTRDSAEMRTGLGIGEPGDPQFTISAAHCHAVCVGNGQLNQVSMSEQANTLDTMHDQQAVLCFQNTGQGWWNESEVGATIRTPCGGDSVKANLVAAVDCRNGKENANINGTLQAKENGGTSLNMNNVLRQQNIVRRLTPLECERLQGYPDGWTDIGDWTDSKGKKHKAADSPRYKALGNSIALPFWQYLARRICAQYECDITMGSLFDGIGGFPLVFERCGAKAVWASEIEEFPIAVTKKHFPEEEP
jgi:DNA (cytosine-5)-methyltransferase 1